VRVARFVRDFRCMKRIVLCWLLLGAFLLPAHADPQRLVGTWKSDRKATLDYLKQHTKLSFEELGKIDPILGKTVLIFDRKTMTAQNGDWKVVTKYAIIREEPNYVVVQTIDPKTKLLEQTRLDLDKDGIWVPEEKVPGYKERFQKVSVQIDAAALIDASGKMQSR
jgi:hypothetical protein